MKKPSILSINNFFYLKGGCERYFLTLNRLLEEVGYPVIPFSTQHPENRESTWANFFVPGRAPFSKNRAERFRAALNLLYSFESRRGLTRLLAQARPQLAHLHNIAHHLTPAILAPLAKAGIPTIQTLHDLKLVCPARNMYFGKEICESCLTGSYLRIPRKRCCRDSLAASMLVMAEAWLHQCLLHSYDQVDAFITPSRFIRNKMIAGGIPPERLHHIPNFIDTDIFRPTYQNEGYLLYCGQLEPFKGVDLLLSALRQTGSPPLIIAGRGSEQKRYMDFCREFRLKVTFAGFQSGEKLCKLIQNSLAVIVPAVAYENQPYTILEAYASGKPVIASRRGGITELVVESETGFLFEAENRDDLAAKIRILQKHPARAVEMGRQARILVEREFNPQLHLEKLQRLYNRFL